MTELPVRELFLGKGTKTQDMYISKRRPFLIRGMVKFLSTDGLPVADVSTKIDVVNS